MQSCSEKLQLSVTSETGKLQQIESMPGMGWLGSMVSVCRKSLKGCNEMEWSASHS